jgi:sugar phosphate isomerase/epimerase
MKNIMPKISSYKEQTENFKDYINKYKKAEIQFFNKQEGNIYFDFEPTVRDYVQKFELEEITIHPPLEKFELEYILFRDRESFLGNVRKAVSLSKELNITINLLYHARWNIELLKYSITPIVMEALEIIGDSNVRILLENSTMVTDRKRLSGLEYCDYINNPHLKFCLDICHVHCHANMYRMDIKDCFKEMVNKELIKKHLYQIHFSYTANNDGYIDKTTHGVVHPSLELAKEDVSILKEYGATNNTIWVTEVGEKDYITRPDQAREIKYLEEIL